MSNVPKYIDHSLEEEILLKKEAELSEARIHHLDLGMEIHDLKLALKACEWEFNRRLLQRKIEEKQLEESISEAEVNALEQDLEALQERLSRAKVKNFKEIFDWVDKIATEKYGENYELRQDQQN